MCGIHHSFNQELKGHPVDSEIGGMPQTRVKAVTTKKPNYYCNFVLINMEVMVVVVDFRVTH